MTPAERLRKNQRLLDKAIRELDQQRVKLERQEKTLVGQIKQSAQKGQMGACKIQAKDLVRTRRYIEKFYGMRSQLQKISLRLQTYRTNEQMMQAMKGATVALGSMNRSMNLPSLQRIAMEFERENDIMEQRQEMMDDAIDDAMDVGVEEEGDEVVEQVLEEIGVDLGQAVSSCPCRIDYAPHLPPHALTLHALCSLVLLPRDCRRMPSLRPRLRRPSAEEEEETTTCRHDWIAYGDKAHQDTEEQGARRWDCSVVASMFTRYDTLSRGSRSVPSSYRVVGGQLPAYGACRSADGCFDLGVDAFIVS